MKHSDSMRTTIALLPAMVAVIILVVNDNIGAGIAVLGAFAIIRFRSAPGTARELSVIFLSMAVGLMCGMQQIPFAIVFTVVIGIMFLLYDKLFNRNQRQLKLLNITVPEDLDYTVTFDDIISKHTVEHTLVGVKTTNMGSMYRITYEVITKGMEDEKHMIDDIRTRNGNLEVAVVAKTDKYVQL